MEIQLGYSCISMLHLKLRCNRCSTKTYLESHSKEECHRYLLEKARMNLLDLKALLEKNKENEILAFRVSEQLLPQIDLNYYTMEELQEELMELGGLANQYHMQLSTHPSQYFVLNSLKKEVVERTVYSLNLFAEMFERMKLDIIPNMTLHVGMKSGYETSDKAVLAFCKNFKQLSAAARSYLVVENDHVSFTVVDCIHIHDMTGIPVVFDNMHYHWNTGSLSFNEAVSRAGKTWGNRIPKFHLSSDKDGKKHAHSEYIRVWDYLELKEAIERTGIRKCYIILECKQKDKALLQLRRDLLQ